MGFVGTELSISFIEKGHSVTVVGKDPYPRAYTPNEVEYIAADTTTKGTWQEEIAHKDAVINLAGHSIFTRWNDKTKKLIHDSRILTTQNVVEAMAKGNNTILCSASAAGYYGFHGDEELAEEAGAGNDFLARLCVEWENEAQKAAYKDIRVIIARFGIVLGKTGGALGKMVPAFKRFVGGPLGNGDQWFPWIHMEDLTRAFLFFLDQKQIHGPVNLCTPNPVRNKVLAQVLGKALTRPAFLKTPAFMLRLVLGEFGSVLSEGQRAVPAKLMKHQFTFHYPEIAEALEELVRK